MTKCDRVEAPGYRSSALAPGQRFYCGGPAHIVWVKKNAKTPSIAQKSRRKQ